MQYVYLLITIVLYFNSTSIAQDFDQQLKTSDVTLNYSETFVFYSEEVQDSFHIYLNLGISIQSIVIFSKNISYGLTQKESFQAFLCKFTSSYNHLYNTNFSSVSVCIDIHKTS